MIDHLFWDCPYTREVWEKVCALLLVVTGVRNLTRDEGWRPWYLKQHLNLGSCPGSLICENCEWVESACVNPKSESKGRWCPSLSELRWLQE
ncbi:hypothetical protein Y1Q_0009300 [Alligator mississippiensis]|uniref:Uncharacterized protein n=1 Tax=Alligator mississippiensis TaxID=8496 RepID=A0A151NGK4_ALLMI|nr:hypothetical protein Y1Q_0009300 [Alligator mississippiensis]